MSDETTPVVPEGSVRRSPKGLTAEDIEQILSDFRSWLVELADAPPAEDREDDFPPQEEPLDLNTLLRQFIALRQEVKLQTKTARAQQEQNSETLKQLTYGLKELTKVKDQSPESSPPLLKTLVEIHDSLSLAQREIQRVEANLLPALEVLQQTPTAAYQKELPALIRLFGGNSIIQKHLTQQALERQSTVKEAANRIQQLLTSLVTGYSMSVNRLERNMQEQNLQLIPTVGREFDPELMEVVEVIADAERATTEVIEEIRRGYLWKGQVFRYAQVRVAKPSLNGRIS